MCTQCIRNQEDIQKIKDDDQKFFFELYDCYWPYFGGYFLKTTNLTEQELKDEIYLKSFLVFIQSIQNGKAQDLFGKKQCTYLVSIGKIMVLKFREEKGGNRLYLTEDVDSFMDKTQAPEIMNIFNRQHLRMKLIIALNKLGEKCREILTLRYMEGWSIEAIQIHLKKPSPNSVSVMINECLKKLASIF